MMCDCKGYITVPFPVDNKDFTFVCRVCNKTLYAVYLDAGVFEISSREPKPQPVEYADID